jgi:hypothetical protein
LNFEHTTDVKDNLSCATIWYQWNSKRNKYIQLFFLLKWIKFESKF